MSNVGSWILMVLAAICALIGLHLRFDLNVFGSGIAMFGVAAMLITVVAYENQ